MSETFTVGDLVAEFLQHCGVETAFGVVSIHNIPMLDAIGRRNAIRFVPARGEAGGAIDALKIVEAVAMNLEAVLSP